MAAAVMVMERDCCQPLMLMLWFCGEMLLLFVARYLFYHCLEPKRTRILRSSTRLLHYHRLLLLLFLLQCLLLIQSMYHYYHSLLTSRGEMMTMMTTIVPC